MSLANMGLSAAPSAAGSSGSGPRSRSGARRNTSYTPPGLHLSMSMPPTPTHGHRLTQSSSAAYIEVAASPRRSAVGLTQERDPSFYRPRSRDGGIPIPGTGIPRRVSDTPPLVSPDGAGATDPSSTPVSRSRLPRTSTAPQQQQQYQILSRPSLQSATSAPPVPITSGGQGAGAAGGDRRRAGSGGRRESFSHHLSSSYRENYSSQAYHQFQAGRLRSGSSATLASVSSAGGASGGGTQYSASPTGSAASAGSGNGGLMPPAVPGYGVSGTGEISGGSGGPGAKRRSRPPSSNSNAGANAGSEGGRWS